MALLHHAGVTVSNLADAVKSASRMLLSKWVTQFMTVTRVM